MYHRISKNISKGTIVLIVCLLTGMILFSCKTRERCAAYGEYRKFKVEQGY